MKKPFTDEPSDSKYLHEHEAIQICGKGQLKLLKPKLKIAVDKFFECNSGPWTIYQIKMKKETTTINFLRNITKTRIAKHFKDRPLPLVLIDRRTVKAAIPP